MVFVYEFKKNAVFRIKEGQKMVHLAFEKTKEERIWKLPIPVVFHWETKFYIPNVMTQYIYLLWERI